MNMVALKHGFVGACLSAVGMLSAAMSVTENVTLQEDTDWRAQGQVTIAAGVTVDLNGHRLAVKGLSCAGAIIDQVSNYQPLEYIQSSGKQWINTGYATTDQTAIEIDFTVTGDWENHAYFCGDWADYGHLLVCKKISKVQYISFYGYGKGVTEILKNATNKRYRFRTVPNGSPTTLLYDGATGELIATASPSLTHSSSGEMTLFAGDANGTYPASYRLHAFRMTDTTTGVVERDYVPVRKLADGEVGLYDRVHGVFYPNNGTEAFVAGTDAGTALGEGRLVVDVSDGATYAVSGSCEARVEIQDGSALAADGDLRCFGGSLELGGTVSLNNHRLRVASLGGYGVLNNGGYRYYRFKVDAVRSGAMMQIGEVKLFCGDAEVTTAYKSLDFNMNTDFSGFTPVKCLDGNLATKWFDNRSPDLMYFIVDFGDPCMITRYQWYTGDDTNNSAANQGRNPKSWRFQGSNDGETWQDLDLVENNTSVTTANKTLAYDKLLVETRSDCLEVDVPAGETFAVTARFLDVLALAKRGQGTLFINDTDVAEVVNVAIDEGCLKIRNTSQMSKASAAGEIRIAEGAQLDVNSAQTATMSLAACEATHGKTIFVAGEGLAGEGAVINTARSSAERYGQTFGRLVLTDDASICGRTGTGLTRMDLRPLTGSAYPNASLEGAYALTLNAGNIFDFYRADFALKELVACGELKFEDANTGVVTNGLRLCDGSRLTLWGMASLPKMPIRVGADATVEVAVESKDFAFVDTLQVGAGAMVTATCAKTLTLAGGCELEGALNQSGASPLLIAGTLSGAGALAGAQVRFTGTNSCWRLVADGTGFTSKVDVAGVSDPTFLMGLGAIELVYLGEHPEGKVLTICPAGDFTPLGAYEISLKVTNGEGTPILNCWLETSDGLLKVHLADAAMPARTAVWTGAAEDGDVANPANWICRNEAEDQIPNALPSEATVVLIGANNRFVCTNSAPLVCGKIKFEAGASLAMDCDWRGLAGIPFEGTLDLAGHKLTVGALKGPATFTDTAHGAGFKYYRFKVNKTRGAVEHAGDLTQGADSLQLAEVKFFNGTQELCQVTAPG